MKDQPGRDPRRSSSDEKILAAAKELFLADRYDGVTLERVAERAGVSRQTVYNRFGAKETVFREMVRHHWAAFDGPDRRGVEWDADASAGVCSSISRIVRMSS